MGRRTKARECAFQILYQREISGEPMQKVVGSFWQVRSGTANMKAMAERLAYGAEARAAELDGAITAAAANWRLDRIAPVDRTILRLGTYELVAEAETPAAVVLDEAIELAKRFGEADSPAFVNGVLDAIRRQVRPAAVGRRRATGRDAAGGKGRGDNEG
jgi:N utilization substance protein B